MDSIEQYFQEEYITEKNRIKEIDDLLNEVIKTFGLQKEVKDNPGIKSWPYELVDTKISVDAKPISFSFSTNSMIMFVVSKLNNKIDFNSPIIPRINWDIDWDNVQNSKEKEQEGQGIKSFINECYNTTRKALVRKCEGELKKERVVSSGSFGDDDPFTLSWIAELIFADSKSDGFKEIKQKFVKICIDKIKDAFNTPNDAILKFDDDDDFKRESSNHIFPLLRIIHLYKTLVKNECFATDDRKFIEDLDISKLVENLQDRINQQISYSVLQNSLFDTAELVLSIEGLILIDDKRRVDENLLTKAFEILKANQKNNLYWRPLKPFVTSPQGDILLPLSIEIANSLLRICKHLEVKKKYYFHDFFDVFENYTKWLLSNVSQCRIDGEEYRGWRSEHVQKPNVIHPWETAQVVIYLMNYKSMIQDHIAYKSLKKSGLSCDDKHVKDGKEIDVNFWNKKWDLDVDFGFPNCYKEIRDKFIIARNGNKDNKYPLFSMLLYGPPGTGKSSIAEDLAQTLNWRLITITPSDFIKYGEADIESRAKSIFKTLEEQTDCVILFDEIDRLILDRDSVYYSNQGDFYQFMTPSMLVKIKDLRTKERSIFIIATNYEERIDSAIKRSGRIDEKYLVNTLNLVQRIKCIKYFLKKEIEKKGHKFNKDINIEKIAKETVLYTYTELKTLVKNTCEKDCDLSSDTSIVNQLQKTINGEEPTIKLSNYKRRFQFEKVNGKDVESSIFPFKEFLALLNLKLESKISIDDDVKLIKRVCDLPSFNLKKYFTEETKTFSDLFDCIEKIKKEGKKWFS